MNETGRGQEEEGRKPVSERRQKGMDRKRRSVVWVGKGGKTKTALGNARGELRKGGNQSKKREERRLTREGCKE
jgi:hypothetical protein